MIVSSRKTGPRSATRFVAIAIIVAALLLVIGVGTWVGVSSLIVAACVGFGAVVVGIRHNRSELSRQARYALV